MRGGESAGTARVAAAGGREAREVRAAAAAVGRGAGAARREVRVLWAGGARGPAGTAGGPGSPAAAASCQWWAGPLRAGGACSEGQPAGGGGSVRARRGEVGPSAGEDAGGQRSCPTPWEGRGRGCRGSSRAAGSPGMFMCRRCGGAPHPACSRQTLSQVGSSILWHSMAIKPSYVDASVIFFKELS